jgi:hypothetical protein
MADTISQELENQLVASTPPTTGAIASMAAKYTLESDRLLGLLLKFDFGGVVYPNPSCGGGTNG